MGKNQLEVSLSGRTIQLINKYFSDNDKSKVMQILMNECRNNLPLSGTWTVSEFERIWFAIIKVSDGQFDIFQRAVELAKIDWRDLLVSANFASDVNLHMKWADKLLRDG